MIKRWCSNQNIDSRSDYFTLNGYAIGEPMPPGVVDRPRGTGDWLIMYFHNPVDVQSGGVIRAIGGASVMIWQPGSYQYYGHAKQPYAHSWIHCDGTLVRSLADSCALPLDTPISGVSAGHFEHHLASLHFEYGQTAAADQRILQNHLHNLFYAIQRFCATDNSGAVVPVALRAARRYIEDHFREKVTLQQLATMANLSVPHFSSEFKKYYGIAPIEYLIRIRLTEAYYLLRNYRKRIGEVAHEVGINDVYYFSKRIKKQYGLSPKALRDST